MISPFTEKKINPRVFVVGCSRSGTTLLQTLIASHPKITTFPETGFFYKTIGDNFFRKIIAQIGFSVRSEIECLKSDILQRLDKENWKGKIPQGSIFFKKNVMAYLSVLDQIAINREKEIWVEKTPLHIMNIGLIQKYVPNAKIIHIVRNGCEVVASIHNRAIEFPEEFKYQDKEYAIKLWNKCIRQTEKYSNNDNHHVVRYEDLVQDSTEELQKIGSFLKMSFNIADFNKRENILTQSTLKKEKWKGNVAEPIENRNSKFEKLFSENDKKLIKNNLVKNKFYKW